MLAASYRLLPRAAGPACVEQLLGVLVARFRQQHLVRLFVHAVVARPVLLLLPGELRRAGR